MEMGGGKGGAQEIGTVKSRSYNFQKNYTTTTCGRKQFVAI